MVRLAEVVQTRYKLSPKRNVPTFEQFVPRYLDYGKANKRGYAIELFPVRTLARFFSGKRLSEITAWMLNGIRLNG